MPTAEVVEARRPLVRDHQVPLSWIAHLNAELLGKLTRAIRLAEAAGINWREDWIDSGLTAGDVIQARLPRLERQSIMDLGRVKTRAITEAASAPAK